MVLAWQDCARLPRGEEPFGFKDGVSQPGIRPFTPHEVRNGRQEAVEQPGSPIVSAGEFVLGHDPEPGSYPAGRRPVPPAWMHDGSFQVFLRLRQDVEGWKAQMDQLRAEVEEDVEAKAVGRTKDGEPLDPGTSGNDFSYDGDAKGVTTPTFAHIRKMNPRNARFQDGTHRLLRRGVPFSTPVGVPAGDGEDELGLAFNAFMASIEDQFEFLQRHWANRSDLPAAGGPDPVTGASNAPCLLERGNGQQPVELDFGRHVWTTGAVYAFAPSITQLRRLAGLDQAGS